MESNVPMRWGFLAGLLAGMAMSALMLAIRLALGIPAFAEVLQDRAIPLVPIFLFSLFIESFGSYAKQMLFGAVVAGQIVAAGVLGVVYAQVWGRNGVYWAEVDAPHRRGWVWRAVPWRSVALFALL